MQISNPACPVPAQSFDFYNNTVGTCVSNRHGTHTHTHKNSTPLCVCVHVPIFLYETDDSLVYKPGMILDFRLDLLSLI